MVKFFIGLATVSIGIMALLAIWAMVYASNGLTSPKYQHDADILRLNDLRVMGEIIQEYKEKTGTYPLEGITDLQHFVLIGTGEQIHPDLERPDIEHEETSTEDFERILSEGLGREISLPLDPQLRATMKPNFYIYMIESDRYFLAVHLHESHGIAKEVGRFYYKLEVSNVADPPMYWDFNELMADETYQAEASESLENPDYFEQLPHRQD